MKQFSGGLLLALFPLLFGLPLAVWGSGFLQVLGVLVLAWTPAFDGILVVTRVANEVSRWRWRGALVGLLGSVLLDGGLLIRVLDAVLGPP